MRMASFALVTALAAQAALAPRAGAQVVFLQNDSYTGGPVTCHTGFDDEDSMAARLTASPGQYPYTIDRIHVFGCGGGQGLYNISIYQDDGGGVNPGALIWRSANDYLLSGNNVFEILMSQEPIPPPAITSGIRVEFFTVLTLGLGFAADTNGITSQRNFVRTGGVWNFSETLGVGGDWILRVGILPSGALPSLSVADVSIAEGDAGTSQAVFTFTLSSPPGQQVSANYTTADGTATNLVDYQGQNGVVSFDIGQTVATVPITIYGDLAAEGDETFTLTLSNPQNAVLGDATAQGTILNDDGYSFHTLTPCRVLDTRTTQPLTTGVDRTIPVTGLCGVPATAKAVSLNIAVTGPTASGFVKLFPAGGAVPVTAAINFSAGQTRANNGIYGLGTGGALVGRSGPLAGTTHLILDVNGYFE